MPDFVLFREVYALGLMKHGEPGRALSQLEVAAKLEPGNATHQDQIAVVLDRLGRRAEATEYRLRAQALAKPGATMPQR